MLKKFLGRQRVALLAVSLSVVACTSAAEPSGTVSGAQAELSGPSQPFWCWFWFWRSCGQPSPDAGAADGGIRDDAAVDAATDASPGDPTDGSAADPTDAAADGSAGNTTDAAADGSAEGPTDAGVDAALEPIELPPQGDAGAAADAGPLLPCDDGNACNGLETRDAQGFCQPGTPPQLPAADTTCDGIDDDCDGRIDEDYAPSCAAEGVVSCVSGGLVVSACDDGNACTLDGCAAGACTHGAVQCDDANACTAEVCDAALGCIVTPVVTDDGNACTVDACDPLGGISHQNAALGSACGASSYCDGHGQCLQFVQCASNLVVAAGQNLALTGPCQIDSLTLSGGSLTVDGPLKTPAISMQNGGALVVRSGTLLTGTITLLNGSIDIAGDIVGSLTQSGGSFTSRGEFDARGTGFSLSAGTFTNAGTLRLASFDASSVRGGTLINRGVLNISSDALVVASGVTLNESGTLGADDSIGSLNVDGTLTHDAALETGLAFTVRGDANVSTNGKIDLSGRGLPGGGSGARPTQPQALGYVSSGGQWVIAAVGSSYSAGSHGGIGSVLSGPMTQSNDSLTAPALLGGGGGGTGVDAPGGNGGGRLDLIVNGRLTVDGMIAANGSSGSDRSNSGAGAGGTLRLRVGTLAGSASGKLQARGGGYGAGAGGGRIAIEFDSMPFSGSMQAAGGAQDLPSGAAVGGAGTLYLKDRSQPSSELIVDNAGMAAGRTIVSSDDGPLAKVTVRGSANLNTMSALSRQWVVSAGSLSLSDGGSDGTFSVSGGTLNVSGSWSPVSVALSGSGTVNNAGTMSLTAASALLMTAGTFINSGTLTLPVFDATNVRGGSFINRGVLNIASNVLTVPAGVIVSESGTLGTDDSIGQLTVLGTLLHDPKLQAGLSFTVTGDATVVASGKIDVSRRGLAGYTGPNNEGAGQGYVWNGTQWVVQDGVGGTTTGGSHAGAGTAEFGQVPGAVYDALDAPVMLGSGGGGSDVGNGSVGANGGGRVDLIVRGTLTVDGTLAANGGDAPSHCGGGAGGALRLQVGRFAGAGTLRANGGAGAGAGGGGRIAVTYTSKSFTGSMQAGASGGAGVGTVYERDLSSNP
jgi:hypothetical protein